MGLINLHAFFTGTLFLQEQPEEFIKIFFKLLKMFIILILLETFFKTSTHVVFPTKEKEAAKNFRGPD